MAVGGSPVIATAALGLVPVISGVQGNIASQLAGSQVMSGADKAGRSIGSRLGSTITSTLKTGLKIGGVLTGAIAGLTLKGGIDRALGIEDAQAKMSGLGHDTQTVEKIMGNALASVEGTAYGLDAAATTAAGAVAAGIKPGQELEGVLTTVANTAAATGGSMDEMGGIFNTVAAVGAAYTGDINMLAQRGVPMWQSLSDVLGVTQDEVRKMATRGEIDFETFAAAAELASGDVASAMGETTRGTFMNMGAAFSRVGATIVTGFLPIVKSAMSGITDVADAVNERLGPIFESFFDNFGGAATAGVEGFFSNIATWIRTVDLAPVGDFFRNVRDWVSELDFSGFGAFFDSLSGVGRAGPDGALAGVSGALGEIAQASPTLLASGLEVLGTAMGFLAEHSDTVVKLLPVIIAGFVAYKLATQGLTTAVTAQRAADIATLPVQIARNATSFAAAVARNRATMAEIRLTAATNTNAATTARATVAERARTIATNIGAAASKTAAIATRLLGAAIRFATGPIGLIITGVSLLAAGLVYFFTKTETGQKLWSKIWGWIKDSAAAVVDWFTGTALPYLRAAWDGIASGALWLYEKAILPAWDGIKKAVKTVGDWITGTLWPAIQTAWDAIGTAALWLYEKVIQPVWTGIKVAIAVAVTAVLVYIDLLKWYFDSVIAPVAIWLYEKIIKPAWEGIKTAIGAVVAWVRDTAWPILKAAWDAIADGAMWLWNNALKPAWDGIRSAIDAVVVWFRDTAWPLLGTVVDWIATKFDLFKIGLGITWDFIKNSIINPVVSWFKNTVFPLIDTVLGWIQMSFEGWKIILGGIWDFVKNKIINPVVMWFRDTAWGKILSPAIEAIKTGFNAMRDGVKLAWDAVKTKAIKPVVDWFEDTVKPTVDTFTGNVKTAFDTLKDNVLEAWESIKDGMKSPINGVINIYNKHIKDNFDKVAEKLFGKNSGPRLPVMSEFYTGGYTGPGTKYQPAGIVHADEYVIRKESQNDLRRKAPGLLDALNRHGSRALGYAGGGLVKLRMPFDGSYPRGEGFGARGGRHKGIDYPMPHGTVLKAVGDGTVGRTWNPAAGNKLELNLGDGLVAGYHHLSKFLADRGAYVNAGADVARVGSTGRSSGSHLHFSMKRDGKYVDPAPYLSGGGSSGSGDSGGWNPFEGLWSKIKGSVSKAVGGGMMGDVLTKVASNTVGWAKDWVAEKLFGSWDNVLEAGGAGIGALKASRWLPVAQRALTMTGNNSEANMTALMRRMEQESGFNPKAINNWDSNAKRGTPSKGLMQVIDPTFRAYRDSRAPNDIWDPLANILASIHYTTGTYGSLTRGWNRKGGYADGGLVKPFLYDRGGEIPPGVRVVANKHTRPEKVLPPAESEALTRMASGSGGSGVTYEFGDIYGLSAADVEREIEKKRRQRAALSPRVRV